MYIKKKKNTYEWKLLNFSNEPEILDLLVFDFFDDINFTSIQSGDFFFSRSNWINKKNSGELSEIQKIPTLDKKAFLTEINKPNSFLSSDVIEIELIKEDLYTANDLKEFYKSKKINIEFVTYWGEKLNSSEIKSKLHGVSIVKKGNSEGIQIELKEASKTFHLKLRNFSDDPTLFSIFIFEYLSNLNLKRISCGNVNFTKEEWIEFVGSKEYSEIPKISTIET